MKFLTTTPANRKTELNEMFNGFNSDFSTNEKTYQLKGVNIFPVINGVVAKYPTWGFVSCKCGKIEVLPAETDREYCTGCGSKF